MLSYYLYIHINIYFIKSLQELGSGEPVDPKDHASTKEVSTKKRKKTLTIYSIIHCGQAHMKKIRGED